MGFARLYDRIVRFVAGPLLLKFVLDLGPLGMGFAVAEVVLGLIFLRLFRFCLFSLYCSSFVIHSPISDANYS